VQHRVNKALAKEKIRETDAAIAAKKVEEQRAAAGRQAAHNMHVAARASAKAASIKAAVAKALKVASASKNPAVKAQVGILKKQLAASLHRLKEATLVSQHASSLASKAAGGKKVAKIDAPKKAKKGKKEVEMVAAGATVADQEEYSAVHELERQEKAMDKLTVYSKKDKKSVGIKIKKDKKSVGVDLQTSSGLGDALGFNKAAEKKKKTKHSAAENVIRSAFAEITKKPVKKKKHHDVEKRAEEDFSILKRAFVHPELDTTHQPVKDPDMQKVFDNFDHLDKDWNNELATSDDQ